MIVKSFELKKIDIKKFNIFLLYGENQGLKKELIEDNFKKVLTNNVYNFNENQVIQNQDNFFDEIFNKSLFENEKLIIVSGVTNKITKIIEELIEKKFQDIYLILVSDKLEKKSKLRSLFEKKKEFVCIPFYADNYQSLNYILINFFKRVNIQVSQEIINLLINRANGDRQSLKNEIDKIENFLIGRKKINLEEIMKLTNMSNNNSYSELVDNCLAKNERKIINMINENIFSYEDTIIIIRTFLTKAKRLLEINNETKFKSNLDEVIKSIKPPVFWKDIELVKQQIKNYNSEKTEKLINTINDTEILIKKNSVNSVKILLDFILGQSKKISN